MSYCKYHPLDPGCTKGLQGGYTPRYVVPPTILADPFDNPLPTPPSNNTERKRRKGVREYEVEEVMLEDRPTPSYGERPRRVGVIEDEEESTMLLTPSMVSSPYHHPQRHAHRQQGNPTPLQLRLLARKHNKRIERAKERAAEFVKIGQHEVIEPRNQHKYGHMTQAAYDYAYEGKKSAMKQLKEGGEYIEELADFEIVPEFSRYDHISLENKKTGELVQVGRGSDTDFFKADKNIEMAMKGKGITTRFQRGVNDWITNAKWLFKNHLNTDTYRNAEADLVGFAESRGKLPGEIRLTGHSKAGATAEYLARKYGNKAYIFNPATHPTSELIPNEEVHPNTMIEVFREEGDFVSSARTYKETPEFMKVHNYTTTPGTETELLGRHDHKLAIPKPSRRVNGNIMAVRNTKLRNRAALLGAGVKEAAVGGTIMAIPALAFQPKYETKSERTYRNKFELPTEMAKGMLEFEAVQGISKVGRVARGLTPGAMVGAYTDLIMLDQEDNVPLHEALAKVRHAIFGKDAPKPLDEYEDPPAVINWFNKNFSHEKYKEDQHTKYEHEMYKEHYLKDNPDNPMNYNEYITRYGDSVGYQHARAIEEFGYDPVQSHSLSTAEMRQAEESYNRNQALREQLEQDPYIRHQMAGRNMGFTLGEPSFNYEAAATEDRRRIKDYLEYAKSEGATGVDMGQGGHLAFTQDQAVAEGQVEHAGD